MELPFQEMQFNDGRKRQDKDEIGEIGLYSELKAREENIDEINEKLLEFY